MKDMKLLLCEAQNFAVFRIFEGKEHASFMGSVDNLIYYFVYCKFSTEYMTVVVIRWFSFCALGY